MDANLNYLTAPNAKVPPMGPSGGTAGVDPNLAKPMNGQAFAGVMRELIAKGERQEIAGTANGTPQDAGTSALQTTTLGNQFAVITTASPLPDSSSLAEFARAQGLSESAVQALFGDLSGSKGALGSVVATSPTDALQTTPLTDPAALGLSNLGMMGMPINPLFPSPSTDPTTLTVMPSATSLGWAQSLPSSSAVADLLQAAGATGVIQAIQGTGSGLGVPPSNALGSADQLAALSPELGPLDAMRMRMVPAWENMTRQLAQLNGTDQAAAWGQLSANILNSKVQGGEGKEVLLDLGADDPDLMSALDAMQDSQNNGGLVNLDSARNTASTGALGAAATSAALANPEMTDRAAQIQDLADKLGKAMGERLQEQMERGEWKLQLKLNPAHLGKIDVELDMNASGLDAVFKSDNLLTRELITQGMPKLKDSLSQSGMTVANVWVNSENQRESGGNSTPRQQTAADSSVNAPVKEVSATETRVKDLRSSNAWDTLA